MRQEKKEISKQSIINSAVDMFATKSYSDTSIRDIAKNANISLGLMYVYFTSKKDLLAEIIRQASSDVIASFDYEKSNKPIENLENYLNHTFEIISRKRNFWFIMQNLRFTPDLMKDFEEEHQKLATYIFEQLASILFAIKGNKADRNMIQFFFTLVDGAIIHYLLFPDYPITEIKKQIINTVKGL